MNKELFKLGVDTLESNSSCTLQLLSNPLVKGLEGVGGLFCYLIFYNFNSLRQCKLLRVM